MSANSSQGFWVPSGSTVRLPPRMRLAQAERERLWRGLERFVNCSDSESDYQAMSRAFPDFWPVNIWHYPQREKQRSLIASPFRIARSISPDLHMPQVQAVLPEQSKNDAASAETTLPSEEQASPAERTDLDWHPVCRGLFNFYRDSLREVWKQRKHHRPNAKPVPEQFKAAVRAATELRPEFLLGLEDSNERALEDARSLQRDRYAVVLFRPYPFKLVTAWSEILSHFATVATEGRVRIGMIWRFGDFHLVPHNDFQRAFYLLFRQNWRARVCPRCRLFFIAQKPKQQFCGTGCSAGSRLASKREWWKRVGAKMRARQGKGTSKLNVRERKTP